MIENYVSYSFENESLQKSSSVSQPSSDQILFDYPCVSTYKCAPIKVLMHPGRYKFKLWGAQGGDARFWEKETLRQDSGGKGALVEGTLHLTSFSTFYFYIGGKGEDETNIDQNIETKGGYNGGGNGGYDPVDTKFPESSASGGGATDIRLFPLSYGEIESLKSRIAVAAGGGGASTTDRNDCQLELNPNEKVLCSNTEIIETYRGGTAGTLFGYSYHYYTITPTQTSGIFGKGGNGAVISYSYGGSSGGSGAGYYGSPTLTSDDIHSSAPAIIGGSGGSSYISGHKNCDSVKQFPKGQIEHSHSPFHYSHFVFRDCVMKSGLETFQNQFGIEENGHSGSGAILITYLGKLLAPTCFCKKRITGFFVIFLYSFII